jgi:diguanylate cyclase (GGDEF)-like protein
MNRCAGDLRPLPATAAPAPQGVWAGGALRGLLGLFLMLVAIAAWPAGGEMLLDASRTDVDGWPWARILEEGDRPLAASEAFAAEGQFGPPPRVHGNLGPRSRALWLRLPLRVGADDHEAWWLDVGFAGVDQVDVYLFENGRIVQQTQVSNTLPFSRKPLQTRNHVLPLPARPGASQELLMRFESSTALLVPLRFVRPSNYLAAESRQQMLQGLVTGIWLCLLVYALVQWVALRERVFIAFALSSAAGSIFFLCYFGQGPQHLWGENVWMVANGWAPAILTMIGANALFVHDALGVAHFEPRLALALRAVTIGAAAAVAAFFAGWVDLRSAAGLASALGPLPTLLGTAAAVLSIRHGNRAAPLVLAGWGVVLVGTLIMVCLQRGWLPLEFWIEHALQFAMTIEIVLWMFVLAGRVKDVRSSEVAARHENARLHTLAFSDPLTGLLNRRGLYLALEQSLPAALPSSAVAVYLIDLDEFKPINDRFGHEAGDALLVEVGRRLQAQMRGLDLVARLGGDEFVVVIHKISDDAVAHAAGRRLLAALGVPFAVSGTTALVGATMGYALAPIDGCDASRLLKCADAGMYVGKQSGKNRVVRGSVLSESAPAWTEAA